MTALSDKIREELAGEIAPCRECGHKRMTITALAEKIGQPATSVGRFLAGGKPSVALLDAADAYLNGRAAAVVTPLLRNYYPPDADELRPGPVVLPDAIPADEVTGTA